MASRSEKVQRRQYRKDKSRKRARELRAKFAPAEDMVIIDSPDGVKMSEVLIELVQPDLDDCPNEDAMNKLLTIGVVAWNAALMPGATRTDFLREMAKNFPSELRNDFYEIVAGYIRKKEDLFPHIQRPIISFELSWLPNGEPHVSVLSGLA